MEDERTETVKILIRSMCFEFVNEGYRTRTERCDSLDTICQSTSITSARGDSLRSWRMRPAGRKVREDCEELAQPLRERGSPSELPEDACLWQYCNILYRNTLEAYRSSSIVKFDKCNDFYIQLLKFNYFTTVVQWCWSGFQFGHSRGI